MTDLDREYRKDEETFTRRYVDKKTWSPAQFIAGAFGLFFLVMGGVALARLLPAGSLTGEEAQVWMFGHTVLLGIVEVVLGLLFLAAAAGPFDAQGGLIGLGVVCLAFGLVVGIEPGAFSGALGVSEETGWLYGIIGAVAILGGWLSPTIVTDRIRTRDSYEQHALEDSRKI